MCIQIGAATIVVKTLVTATLVLTSYDLYDYWLVVKIVLYCLFEKTENKRKRGRGWPIFFKKTSYDRL